MTPAKKRLEKSKDLSLSKMEHSTDKHNGSKLVDRSQETAGEKIYRDYLNLERRRELEEILTQFKKETEAKFIEFSKDVKYLSEMMKYMSQVNSTHHRT